MAVKLHKLITMRISILFTILFFSLSFAHAGTSDSTRTVQVGDSVFIAPCPGSGFSYIQFYQKTRFTNPTATYDKATGDDFYEYFFLDGDFDVKPLPCAYGGKKYRIISIRTLVDKTTGADRPVMFLELAPNTVAWVELSGAVDALEIYLE